MLFCHSSSTLEHPSDLLSIQDPILQHHPQRGRRIRKDPRPLQLKPIALLDIREVKRSRILAMPLVALQIHVRRVYTEKTER